MIKKEIAKNNSIALDYVITQQMLAMNFEGEDGSGSEGVVFYDEKEGKLYLVPSEDIQAFGAASQSSHRVGLPSSFDAGGKTKGYYLLERLMEWAVTGKRRWN